MTSLPGAPFLVRFKARFIPTTAAHFGDALYVVNARFEDAAPLTAGMPDIDYAIMRVAQVATEQ